MSDHLKVLFEAALQDYETKTGITLAEHPLAERLQECDSVESITAVLHEQTQAFNQFRGKDKVMKYLKNAVSVLYNLSAYAKLGEVIHVKASPIQAIHSGLAILLSVIKGVKDSYDALVELLESIEHILYRLDIYTKITPTVAMTEILVKILVELLSTLALATKEVRQGKPKKFVKKLFGEKDIEAVLQRLNRLTLDEAKLTAAQILEVVHGLVQNMRVVTDDSKTSLDCVRNALETMNEIASDMSKSKRDKLQRDVRRWLSPPDPWKNHNIARGSQHSGTAEWLVQGNDTFSAWKASDPSSLLWIHGKPGAGKSVLCSSIIQDIIAMQKAGLASLAFFYCDFREDQKKDLRGLLSSLLVQLCHQSNSYSDILFKFYSEHAEGSRHPSDDELARCLTDLLKLPGHAPVYVIVDALDECPNTSAVRSPRAKVLNLIQELIESQFPNLRICVTSRPEIDIKDVLDTLTSRSISLHDENGQKGDIEGYIKSVIYTHPRNKRWKAEHKQLVIDVLTEKANGMFRWVDCQLGYICGCIPARIQHALVELPVTLDETYERTLREINEADWEIAHRLFQFVAVAWYPLHVEVLAELLAFDFKTGPIPKFREDWRLEDPVDAVLSACSSLLAVVEVYGSPVIQFSHFSVKEFLTSARLAEASDIIHRRYHVSMTPAHTLASQACLGTLLHLDKDTITRDSLADYRLAEYAARYWAYHARFEGVSQRVEDGMKQLLDPNKPHLTVCVWIYQPERGFSYHLFERPSQILGSPLHYAALWGLHSIVHFLLVEHSQDVHSRVFDYYATPLHLASENGHKQVAHMLMECGADISVRDGNRDTPLHRASSQGRVEVVHMLLERGADVSAKNNFGDTPLHQASSQGNVEVVHMLIERGAHVSPQDEYGDTPLHRASSRGHVEVARMLIEYGAELSAHGKHGNTPLYEASSMGHVEVARLLIERGADASAWGKYGNAPLHEASISGHVEVVHMLIERGADVSAHGMYGNTPLHVASSRGRVEVVHMLLERGADPSAKDNFGKTPLHEASISGHVEVVHILIERGAELSARDDGGDTALHRASSWGQVAVAHILIERGADISAQDGDGETPLHEASNQGCVEVVHMLIERGADVSVQGKYGNAPLHEASISGHVEVVHMLIERGAHVSAQGKYGNTPLHEASSGGHVEVVQMLIERGAHVSAQNNLGNTPLHQASSRGHVEVVQMLIERGANVSAQDKERKTPLHLLTTHKYSNRCRELAEIARILLEHGANVTAQDNNELTPLDLASQDTWFREVADVLIQHGAGTGTH